MKPFNQLVQVLFVLLVSAFPPKLKLMCVPLNVVGTIKWVPLPPVLLL